MQAAAPKIYWLSANIPFHRKLSYSSAMQMEAQLCPANPTHTMSQRWPRPLQVVAPVRPLTDFEWTVYGDLLICLLYTSDAADERSSVDLGGRRIIKKK